MNAYQGRPKIAVVVVVRPEDGRVLIVRRSQGDFRGGEWEVPGGHIDPGETAVEAAEREVREETGLECKVWDAAAGRWTSFRLRDNTGRWGVMFGAGLMGGRLKLKLDEHDDHLWVSPAELRRLAEENEPYLMNESGTIDAGQLPPCGIMNEYENRRPKPAFPMPPWMVESVAHIAGIALGQEDVPRPAMINWEAFWPPGPVHALTVGPLIKGWLAAAKARVQR